MQGQHPPAPFIALAARLDGFDRDALHAAIDAKDVAKATLMRQTLHLAAADDLPAYARLSRETRMRPWRKAHPHLDEVRVEAELRAWFAEEPRSNAAIRERVRRYEGVGDEPWAPLIFARTLLPLVQLPPAGFYDDPRRPLCVVDPRPSPAPAEAAAFVLRRYLAAFGPASRRDFGAWAGIAQRDFAGAFDNVETVSYRDENGTELLDLPDQPLPPADTPLPPRLLAHWDQTLLAYADRERIIPAELRPLKLTLSGDPTVTVDGRVAASWALRRDGDGLRVTVTPHTEIRRAAREQIRAEAERVARVCEPGATRVDVDGV